MSCNAGGGLSTAPWLVQMSICKLVPNSTTRLALHALLVLGLVIRGQCQEFVSSNHIGGIYTFLQNYAHCTLHDAHYRFYQNHTHFLIHHAFYNNPIDFLNNLRVDFYKIFTRWIFLWYRFNQSRGRFLVPNLRNVSISILSYVWHYYDSNSYRIDRSSDYKEKEIERYWWQANLYSG